MGNRTKIKVVKNKVAAPFREAEVDILYGQGICRETDLLDVAVAQNLVEKSRSWYSFHGERTGRSDSHCPDGLISRDSLIEKTSRVSARKVSTSFARTPGARLSRRNTAPREQRVSLNAKNA